MTCIVTCHVVCPSVENDGHVVIISIARNVRGSVCSVTSYNINSSECFAANVVGVDVLGTESQTNLAECTGTAPSAERLWLARTRRR